MVILDYLGEQYQPLTIKLIVEQWDTTLVDRNVIPRMPWHDCTIGVVSILAMHRVDRGRD